MNGVLKWKALIELVAVVKQRFDLRAPLSMLAYTGLSSAFVRSSGIFRNSIQTAISEGAL